MVSTGLLGSLGSPRVRKQEKLKYPLRSFQIYKNNKEKREEE